MKALLLLITGFVFFQSASSQTTTDQQNCIDSSIIDTNAVCIMLFDPVCGCNGNTYSNSCIAKAAGVTCYVKGSCDQIDFYDKTKEICTNKPLQANIQPKPKSINLYDTLKLRGNPEGGEKPYTHKWKGSAAQFLNDTDIENPKMIPDKNGIYRLIYTVIDHKQKTYSDTTSIWVNPVQCEYSGTVKDYTGLDGCSLIIELDNGTKLEPYNIVPNIVLKDGQRVKVSYTELSNMASICMVGKIVRLDCVTIISQPPKCQASFDYNEAVIECLNKSTDCSPYTVYLFTDSSTASTEITGWEWHFGDGSTSNIQNPMHAYSISGEYKVCLTIKTTTGCSNTRCATDHFISGISYAVSGKIFADRGYCYNAIVIAYKEENKYYKPVAFEWVDSGKYQFNELESGTYLFQAIPHPKEYNTFLPTFYKKSISWDTADKLNLDMHQSNIDIQLVKIKKQLLNGNGVISGKISFADSNMYEPDVYSRPWFPSNKAATNTINPAENMPVFLFDNSGEPVSWTLSDERGNYFFEGLPNDAYQLSVSKAGFSNITPTVAIDNQIQKTNTDLVIKEGRVVTGEAQEVFGKSDIYIAPIPVKNILTVKIKYNNVIVSIYNLKGEIVFSSKISSGNFRINTQDWPAGLYLAKVMNVIDGKTQTIKIIKE